MPSTGQEATQGVSPTRSFPPEHPNVRATMGSLTSDDVAQLDGLVDVAEKNTDDPDAALATLAALTNLRIATRRSPGSVLKDDATDERGQSPPITHAPGGAMPSQTTTPASTRRPFVGYDREREAYERLKADLLSARPKVDTSCSSATSWSALSTTTRRPSGPATRGSGWDPCSSSRSSLRSRPIEVTRFVAQ